MLNYTKLIESSSAFNIIKLDRQKGRLSHAYLFCHVDRNFLRKFAERVCALIIDTSSEKDVMRIEKQVHPDVMFFGVDKPVDAAAASKIVETAQVSPFEADKKIFVIVDADEMNESAQNKLLKTIEEPPQNTYFILLGASTSKFLQTVLSRVKQITLDEIEPEELAAMLCETGLSSDRATIFANCSAGNGEFAERLSSDSGFIEFFNSVVDCLKSLSGSRDVLKYSAIFSAKNVDKDEFFNIVMLLIRDIQVILSGAANLLCFKNIQADLVEISKSLNLSGTKILLEECLDAKKKLNYNVNPTSVVDYFLFKLAEVKIKCRK